MNRQLGTILLVEDNRPDAVLIEEMLARHIQGRGVIRWVRTLRETLDFLARESCGAILLDLSLPDSHGLDTIRQVSAVAGATPILVITGSNDDRTADEAVCCGAEDYLVKGQTDARSMVRAIQYAIDRRKAEQKLRESEEKYRQLFNLTDEIICVHEGPQADGLPGRFLEVNDAACRIWGYSREELLRMRPADIDATESLSGAPVVMRRLLQHGRAVWEGLHVAKDGRRFPVEISNVFIDFHGKPALLSTARDITKRKRAEESQQRMQSQLAHVARLSNMGEMAAGIAHELGQPLYAVLNYAKACRNLLNGASPDLELLAEYLDKIAGIAAAAGSIGRRLRSFARRAEQERSACDVNEIVQEAVALVAFEARQHNVCMETTTTSTPATVWASRVEIQQVLANLLMNAFEAMEKTPLALRRVDVRTALDAGSAVVVSVCDYGRGIPPGEEKKIFDAFATTKTNGLGMGLTISATIIENYGGKIWTTPNPAGGACVHFQLPLYRSERKHAT